MSSDPDQPDQAAGEAAGQAAAAALEARAAALEVVHTTTTPRGQTVDWVPPESLAGGPLASPPPRSGLPAAGSDPQRPVFPVAFELDDPAVERGPSGTVPVARPGATALAQRVSLNGHLYKRGGLRVNRSRPPVAATAGEEGYFHAIASELTTAYGCDGFLNVWSPAINVPPGPSGDDHSIMQIWVQNDDTAALHSIEGGWSVDDGLNGSAQPHFFTYYTTNGYAHDGANLGGYNRVYSGWVQVSPTIFPGIGITSPSVQAGKQFELSFKFQLYQGNWWIAIRDEWIGYYPAILFKAGLQASASWIGFGGEVYSGLAVPSTTRDQMGSGRHAADGWTQAAFMRNLRMQTAVGGTMAAAGAAAATDEGSPGANPYTMVAHMNSGPPWGSYAYLGGPSN